MVAGVEVVVGVGTEAEPPPEASDPPVDPVDPDPPEESPPPPPPPPPVPVVLPPKPGTKTPFAHPVVIVESEGVYLKESAFIDPAEGFGLNIPTLIDASLAASLRE